VFRLRIANIRRPAERRRLAAPEDAKRAFFFGAAAAYPPTLSELSEACAAGELVAVADVNGL
jgi:hypothetical protein